MGRIWHICLSRPADCRLRLDVAAVQRRAADVRPVAHAHVVPVLDLSSQLAVRPPPRPGRNEDVPKRRRRFRMAFAAKLRHAPLRAATGAYILSEGLGKMTTDDEEKAKAIHAMGADAYPVLGKIGPKLFLK